MIRETHYTDANGQCVEAPNRLDTPFQALEPSPDGNWRGSLRHACDASLRAVGGACDLRSFSLSAPFTWEGGTLRGLLEAMDRAGQAEGQQPLSWSIRQQNEVWVLLAGSALAMQPEPAPRLDAAIEYNRRLEEITEQEMAGTLDQEAARGAVEEAARELVESTYREEP